MNKSIKFVLMCTAFFMIISCSSKQTVFIGDTVDIENYTRPSNIVKYQWSFDTKPPTSRLDPRDFIPSNYHPNVTFIPDSPGRYIVRLTMINAEGTVIYKNFIYMAEAQPDYLAAIKKPKKEKTPPSLPKIVEVPKVVEKIVHKKTTITKIPNEWQEAPKPGEDPEGIKKEPVYTTKSVTEIIKNDKLVAQFVKTTLEPDVPVYKVPENAKYTLQVSSTTVEAFAVEFRDKLLLRGYDAFIQTAVIDGVKRYRIRVGHYVSYQEAKISRQTMLDNTEFEPWIDRIK
ncbi:MAG: SPOR domain-containing protein [Candidatus Marinimicrobia bacterium]|nr:SPOR domain-containing protein [Candidatus Neomarinimicrobiota bacterium]